MPFSRHLPAFLLLLGLASPLSAHDLWLDLHPDPSAGKIVVHAVLGAKFPKVDEVKKVEGYLEPRLIAGRSAGPIPDFGKEPTLIGRVTTDQPFAVSVLGPTREIDLKVEEAREYLKEEVGLPPERIAAIVDGASPSVHETYSRILKAIRAKPQTTVPSPFGLPVEINLLSVRPAEPDRWEITFEVRKENQGVPDAFARILAAAKSTQHVRTDRNGRGRFSVPRGSPILIAYIELVSAEKGRYQTRWTNLAIFLK